MSPPPYSNPKTPEFAGVPRGVSVTTDGRPSTAFVLALLGSLLLVSVVLCCIVYVSRKRALAAADLEASRLAQDKAVVKQQEELEYQELGEKLLGQTDLPFKSLILGATYSKEHNAAYKCLALPLLVRYKEGHNATVSQIPKMNERPHWMPRPQWIKRSAISYKRASTSNINFSFCHRHQKNATAALKSSVSCPGGFQKHQFKSKNTSTRMPSGIPSQPSTTVTDKELTFGSVDEVLNGKDHVDDVVSDENGVNSVSELSDESFSSIECVLGSSLPTSVDSASKQPRSALDKIADDLLFNGLSQDRQAELHTRPASELFEGVHNERLNAWFDNVRDARYKGGEDLVASRTLPHLHTLKAVSFSAKRSSMGTAKPRSLSMHTLPLYKRPSRVISRSRRGYPLRPPVDRFHMAVFIAFSGSRATTSTSLLGMRGVSRPSNIILCSLGTTNKTRRLIHAANASGAKSPSDVSNIAELDDTDLFPLFNSRPHNGIRTPSSYPAPATNKAGRAPLGAITNNTDVLHLKRPLASPLLLINGVVADEVFVTKQVGGLGNPTLDLPPQDNNLLNLTWMPKSLLRPITLKVTVKSHKPESSIGTGRTAGRARSGSFFSRGRGRYNQNKSESEDTHTDGVLHILDVTTYAESSFQDFSEAVEHALGYRAYFRGRVYVKDKEMYLPLLAEKHFRHWLDDRLAEGVAVAHIDAWRRDY